MNKYIKFFSWTLFLLFIVNYLYIFYVTPVEVNQGLPQKIMYLHVPAILTSYFALFVLFISSIGYILTKSAKYDIAALVSGEIAVILLGISLISGAIWGKPTWNTYWAWDARLIISLITFIFFCGYLLFRRLSPAGHKASSGAAVIAIGGFFAVPLNHLAVSWFNSLHQGSTIFKRKPLIDPILYYPLISSMLLFLLLFLVLFYWRARYEKSKIAYFNKKFNN